MKEENNNVEVSCSLEDLKIAIRETLENQEAYIYDCEPRLDFTDHDTEVCVNLDISEWDIDRLIDDGFVKNIISILKELDSSRTITIKDGGSDE
jgi:hypothetical protein